MHLLTIDIQTGGIERTRMLLLSDNGKLLYENEISANFDAPEDFRLGRGFESFSDIARCMQIVNESMEGIRHTHKDFSYFEVDGSSEENLLEEAENFVRAFVSSLKSQ